MFFACFRIMGDALIWQLVRNNNSFLVKRGGGGPKAGNSSRAGAVQFSCEPGNVMGVNTFKYSGLAKAKAVGIEQTGTDLSLDMKAYKKANLPSKSGESRKAFLFFYDRRNYATFILNIFVTNCFRFMIYSCQDPIKEECKDIFESCEVETILIPIQT